MAAIGFALALSFAILTLLSRSSGNLADQAISHRQRRWQQLSSHDAFSSSRARRIGTHVAKKLSDGGEVGGGGDSSSGDGGSGDSSGGSGGGSGSGGGGGGGRGGGRGGGPIRGRPTPTGTDGQSAVSSGQSTLVSAVSCSLSLALLLASTLIRM